jgi:hypothetical protein
MLHCVFCKKSVSGAEEALQFDWEPSYWDEATDAEVEKSVCGPCVGKLLVRPRDGIMVLKRDTALGIEARAYLAKAAEETVYYVALGNCLKRDLAEKFGLTEGQIEGLLARAATKLVNEIRAL